MLMACGKSSRWSIWAASEPSGPWKELAGMGRPKPFGNNTGMEDPMIWQDHNGHFHILAHAFTQADWPAQMVSAHAFSHDARHWTWSTEHPFSWNVKMSDGTEASFATMERPKLAFGVDGVMGCQPTCTVGRRRSGRALAVEMVPCAWPARERGDETTR
jgi:hypothetical protein